MGLDPGQRQPTSWGPCGLVADICIDPQNGLDVEEDLYQAVKNLDTPIISAAAWIGVMTSTSGDSVSWGVKVRPRCS